MHNDQNRSRQNVVVRRAEFDDWQTIAQFNQALAAETESKFLPDELIVPGVQKVFSDPAKGQYFVACHDSLVVGQMMITFEWSDWRNGWFWWIQSVYVRQEWRRQGIFKQIFQYVEQLAHEQGDVVGLRLYVEKENLVAQTTYGALKMFDSGYYMFEKKLQSKE
ncbi:MAG: GNAT family N-acetyltransferase [Zavarzinella sp.]